jgi:hypothetical protein
MHAAAAPVAVEAASATVVRPSRPLRSRFTAVTSTLTPPGVLGWVPRLAGAVLVVQLAFLVAWSLVEWRRFGLTYDFFVYFRSWHAFWANGLNPFDAAVEHLSLANNGTLIVWPLALLTRIYPHGIVLLLVQDLALVAAEIVALRWMAEALKASPLAVASPRLTRGLLGLGLVLLVANPWIYWASSYDFHVEIIAAAFVLLAARAMMRRRWASMALWAVGTLACGFVAATYLIGLALTALIVGGGRRLAGLIILAGGALLVLLATLDTHLSGGFTAQFVSSYGYLGGPGAGAGGVGQVVEGALSHPGRVAGALWGSRADIMANLAPAGLVGMASPWVLGVGLVVLLTNELDRYIGGSAPGFQSMALYMLVPIGTVLVLARVALRGASLRRFTPVLAGVLCVNALAWGFVGLLPLPSRWLTVSPAAAAVLASVDARIGLGAEVVASEGIVGRFGDRRWVYPIVAPGPVPVEGDQVWFVLDPAGHGVVTETTAAGLATVAELRGPLHAQLVASGAGVWAFRWTPPPGVRSVDLPAAVGALGAPAPSTSQAGST